MCIRDSNNRTFTSASAGKRFTNYLIDTICYYLFAILIGGGLALLTMDESAQAQFLESEGSLQSTILEYVLGAIIVLCYYTISEYYLKGKTIGKYITKTRAVSVNNESIDLGTAFKRSLSRIVPFEPFSFLGNDASGWHDKWTDTKVIEDTNWSADL